MKKLIVSLSLVVAMAVSVTAGEKAGKACCAKDKAACADKAKACSEKGKAQCPKAAKEAASKNASAKGAEVLKQ